MIGIPFFVSAYTFLNSTLTIETMVKTAKEKHHEVVFLCDTNLHGMLQFFKMTQKYEVKGILGQQVKIVLPFGELTLLLWIQNMRGYQNVLKLNLLLTDRALQLNDIQSHHEGLSVMVSHDQLYHPSHDHPLNFELLDQFFQHVHVVHGVYQLEEMKNQAHYILMHPTHYLSKEDQRSYQTFHAIQTGQVEQYDNLHMLDGNAIQTMYQHVSNYDVRFIEWVNQFEFVPNFKAFKLPQIPLEKGITSKQYLEVLAQKGLDKRLQSSDQSRLKLYKERLTYELSVIFNMQFEDYFLLVYDLIKYAKTHHILVGPGRGSVAGSLVAYAIGITEVDPIQYDLLFERFLNPERITMPDIDMDFPDKKREEVILYAMSRFGTHHIASIVTMTTFSLKSSIRDLAKVLEIDVKRAQKIVSDIENNTLNLKDSDAVQIKQLADHIEGLPRQTGTHAAGMILSKEDLTQYIPLQKGPYPFYQTQFQANELEELGLLKVDFLGIRNLTIIEDILKLIKQDHEFDLKTIPFDDQKTFELLTSANTSGIFQLESSGMRQFLKKLQPKHFEDIVVLLALYRPGPMGFIDDYIERKNGSSYEPLHPQIESILTSTYGIIVYQEQIMKVAQVFAGYSLSEADLLRRGVSKKDISILEKERKNFINRAIKLQRLEEDANKVYDIILKFSDYGFNRSHSVSYAIIAYQMAFLKAHYGVYFMVSLLNSVIGNSNQIDQYIQEAKASGIDVLPPNINFSRNEFIVDHQKIIAPLNLIKTINKPTAELIIKARQNGPFKDYESMKSRLKQVIQDKHLEALIWSSALDDFSMTKQTLMNNISMDTSEYSKYVKDFKYQIYEEFDFDTLMKQENSVFGFNIKYTFTNILQKINTQFIQDLKFNNNVQLHSYLLDYKAIKTKNGAAMAFATFHDGVETFEVTIFPKVYEKVQQLLKNKWFKIVIKKDAYESKEKFVLIHLEIDYVTI
jgi:DNA polymerase III subunit alpha